MNISTTDNHYVAETHIPDTTRYAADLFSQLTPEAQNLIIDLLKSLLFEK